MMSVSLAICVSVLTTTLAWAGAPCNVVTDWGDTACSLGGSLHVVSVKGDEVSEEKCDKHYNKLNFAQQPEVTYREAIKGETYTLVMLDPDAPNHPKGQYFLHWIVANIPGESLKGGIIQDGKTIVGYRPPTPPKGTGVHRYQFVVFRHDDSAAKISEVIADDQRRKWSLENWLDRQKAAGVKLCGPLSGVQFMTDYGATA